MDKKKLSTLFFNKKKLILSHNGAMREIQCGRSNFYTQAKSDVETQTDRACMDCLKCHSLLGIGQRQKDEIDKLMKVVDEERNLRINAEQLANIAETESADFRQQLFLQKTRVIEVESELSNLQGELKRVMSTSNCYKTKSEQLCEGAEATRIRIAELEEQVQGLNGGIMPQDNKAELISAHAKLSKSKAKVKDLQSKLALAEEEIKKLKNMNKVLKAPDFLSSEDHKTDKMSSRKSSSDLDRQRQSMDLQRRRIPSVPPPSFKTVMKAQTKSNLIKSKSHVATLTKPTLVPRQSKKSKSFLSNRDGTCQMSQKKKNVKVKAKLERSQKIQEKLDRFESSTSHDQPKNKQDKKPKKKEKNIKAGSNPSHIPVKSKGFLDKLLSKSQEHEDKGKAKHFAKNSSLDLPDIDNLFCESGKKPIPLHTTPSIVISSFESGSDWSSSEEEQWIDLTKSGEFTSSYKMTDDEMRHRQPAPPPIAPKPGRKPSSFVEGGSPVPPSSRGRSPTPSKPLPQIPFSQRRTPSPRPNSPNCRASSPFMQSQQSQWKLDPHSGHHTRTSAPYQADISYFDAKEYKPQLTGYQRAKGPAGRRRPNSKGKNPEGQQNPGHRHMNGIV